MLGFTVVFSALGLFAGTIGALLREYKIVVNIIGGMLVVVFGLSYLEFIKLPFFKGVQSGRTADTAVSAFLFGVVYSVSLTPCIGAFLGSALALAGASGTAVKGVLLLVTYSLGLGVPFLLSALLIEKLNTAFSFIKKHYRVTILFAAFSVLIGSDGVRSDVALVSILYRRKLKWKFDQDKIQISRVFRRLLQNRQMKYVLLAVAFSVLITGSVLAYGVLSRRYEQEIQPPVRTEQTMKTKPGTKATNEKKTAETTNEGENTAIPLWRARQQRVLKNRLKKKRSELRVQQSSLSAIPVKILHQSHRLPECHSNRRTRKNRRMRKNKIIQRILPVLQSRNPECQIQNRLLRNNRKQPLLKQILP